MRMLCKVKRTALTGAAVFLLAGCAADAPSAAEDSAPDTSTFDAPGFDATHFDALGLWAEVRKDFELFYAYLDARDVEAQAYLDRVGEIVGATTSEAEARRELHRATFAFADPHLSFGPLTDTDFNVFPTSSDLVLKRAGDTFEIADVRAGSAAAQAGLRPGFTGETVDGRALSDHVGEVFERLVETPTDAQAAYAATLAVNGRRVGTREMSVTDASGQSRSLSLTNPKDFAAAVSERPPVEVERVGRLAVVRINNRLGDNALIEGFDAVMEEVADADGLILDMRNTPSGGNTEVGRSILGHFTTRTQPYQRHSRPSLEREFSVPRQWIELVAPRAPYFAVERTVVLGGPWTGSMGEGIVIGMDALGATVIASDMGDLLGAMSQFRFADERITHSIATERLFHVDGTPREDFVADQSLPSADTDAAGGDPALRTAIELLSAPD